MELNRLPYLTEQDTHNLWLFLNHSIKDERLLLSIARVGRHFSRPQQVMNNIGITIPAQSHNHSKTHCKKCTNVITTNSTN